MLKGMASRYSQLSDEQKEKARERARERYWRDADAGRARSRAVPKELQRQRNRDSRARLRAEVLGHYGGSCACCGESNPKFLTIEHVNGGGRVHRLSVGGGLAMLYDIRRRGYPDDFTVLCFNCNQGSYHNGGICPHKE